VNPEAAIPISVPMGLKNGTNTGIFWSYRPEMMTEDAKFALGF
jgi:hypothetical protein